MKFRTVFYILTNATEVGVNGVVGSDRSVIMFGNSVLLDQVEYVS